MPRHFLLISGARHHLVGGGDGAGPSGAAVVFQGVTFQFQEGAAVGYDAGGKPYVVGAATLEVIAPGASSLGGDAVSGAMLNPLRTDEDAPAQGYDERYGVYDGALAAELPLALSPGDIVIATIADPAPQSRRGVFSKTSAVHVVAEAPAPGAYLPASLGWEGRTQNAPYIVDEDAWFSGRTLLDDTGVTWPSFAQIMDALGTFSPITMQVWNAVVNNGYEGFSTVGVSGADGPYGPTSAELQGIVLMALHSNAFSETEIRQMFRKFVQLGIEWGDPLWYGPAMGADGGHRQKHLGCGLFALKVTGREAEIPAAFANSPGNWSQAFQTTAAYISSHLSPHTDPTKPSAWHQRVLGAQPADRSVVRIPYSDAAYGDSDQTKFHVGSRVTDGTLWARLSETVDCGVSGAGDLPILGVNPFAEGDTVWIEPDPAWINTGGYDWLVSQREPQWFCPSADRVYRDLQPWTGMFLGLMAAGATDASMDAVRGYIELAMAEDRPAPGNEYPSTIGTWRSNDGASHAGIEMQMYANNWANLLPVHAATTATTTLTHAITPGATGAMVDGLVVGLVGDTTEAMVQFKGVSSQQDTIEVRVLREADEAVVMDWTEVAHADGAWQGSLLVPKSTGWDLAEARCKGNPSAVTRMPFKFGVGYKVMLLGQSQVVIMLRQPLSLHDMQHPGTASYYDNQDAAPIFGLIDTNTAGGGLQAMVDQFRAFDPDTPLMLVREAIPGQGTLDLVDDSRPGRTWADMQERIDAYGGDYTAVVQMWPSEDSGDFSNDAEAPYRILIGDTDWIAQSPYAGQVDHTLADVLQPGYVFAQVPATRHKYSLGDMRASEIAVAIAYGLPIGPPIVDYQLEWLGDRLDNGHPEPTGPGNIRFGARMGVTLARALDLDTSQNPYITGTSELSADGRTLIVPLTPVNGGAMFAIEPSDLSGWRVDNDPDGFVAELHDNSVWLVKDSGTWAPTAQASKVSNLTINAADTQEEEIRITQGEVYETWAPDILGLGIPVHGTLVGGDWTLPTLTVVAAPTAGTQTASAPDAFAEADWTATDAANGGEITIAIARLPKTNGAPLTALEYRIDGGAWTDAGGVGDFTITGLTVDAAIGIELRVVNAVGDGAPSDTKSATPTGAGAPSGFVRNFASQGLGDNQANLAAFAPVGANMLAEVVANAAAPGGQALAFWKTTGNLNELTDTAVTTAARAGFTTLTVEGAFRTSSSGGDRYFIGSRKGATRMTGLFFSGDHVFLVTDVDAGTLNNGVGNRVFALQNSGSQQDVSFKLEITGDTIRGKAWPSSGSEPVDWVEIITSDNSAITVDAFGLFARTNGTVATAGQLYWYEVNAT